jgi:hypothetical protein
VRNFRKLTYANPKKGGYLSISIPIELCSIFIKTRTAIVEAGSDGKSVIIRPAVVSPLCVVAFRNY